MMSRKWRVYMQCRHILGKRKLVYVLVVVAAIFDFMTKEDWGDAPFPPLFWSFTWRYQEQKFSPAQRKLLHCGLVYTVYEAFNSIFSTKSLEFPLSLDFLKVLYFFPGWFCHFIGLFIPVWWEIHWSKILPVTSWQFANRTVSDTSRQSRHSICQSFFPLWIYNMIQIHLVEASRPRNFDTCSVATRPHA